MKINQRGQSTVEYILLVTAVIAVLIVFFSTGGFKGKMDSTISSTSKTWESKTSQLTDAQEEQGDATGSPGPEVTFSARSSFNERGTTIVDIPKTGN